MKTSHVFLINPRVGNEVKNAKLVKSVRNKESVRINILEQMKEEKILLENLHIKNTIFNGTHKMNAIILKGKLPEHRSLLLDKINKSLEKSDQREMTNKELSKWKKFSLE